MFYNSNWYCVEPATLLPSGVWWSTRDEVGPPVWISALCSFGVLTLMDGDRKNIWPLVTCASYLKYSLLEQVTE